MRVEDHARVDGLRAQLHAAKSPKAMKRPVRRPREIPEDRYDEIVE